ncbi:MAG: hypothetical protein AB7O98_04530 [Hyphomonadaceae bacterium]
MLTLIGGGLLTLLGIPMMALLIGFPIRSACSSFSWASAFDGAGGACACACAGRLMSDFDRSRRVAAKLSGLAKHGPLASPG